MLPSWILVLLLLPGWLLPSGLRVPLCGCLFAPAERSCCAPVETHACCASDTGDEDDGSAPSVEREPACACSVAVPDHDGSATTPTPPAAAIPPSAPARIGSATFAPRIAETRAERERPRGPSPGGANPLPLRL